MKSNTTPLEDLVDSPSRQAAAKKLLRRIVLSGEVGHGEQLAPEMQLCREMNLSRTTIRRAIRELVDEGLLIRQQGRGTFVNFQRTQAQSRMLGILVPCHAELPNNAYDLLVEGAKAEARARGYGLVVADSRNESASAMEQVVRLNERRVAGSLVVPLLAPGGEGMTAGVIKALKAAGQEVVVADSPSMVEGVPSVSSRNEDAVHELTSALIGRGYRRIAFLTADAVGSVREREAGFLRAMEEHALPVPPHYFLKVGGMDVSVQGVQEVDVFMAMREPPQAIVCLHDLIALNVLRRCRENGWSVPGDVAVVGFDDLLRTENAIPPLTTVHQPLFEMGVRAVRVLDERLRGEMTDNAVHDIRLPCHIIPRGSW